VPDHASARPNLEQLRKQAKELAHAFGAQAPEALARWDAHFPRRPATLRLSHALAVIAREHGFASWPRLKAHLAAGAAPLGQPRVPRFRHRVRKGPKRPPSRRRVQELYAYTMQLVRRGDPAAFALEDPPSGPYGATTARALRALLVERGTLEPVVELVERGLGHPNARVRFACAHALDWLGDDRCVPALSRLLSDPAPRVRWVALHALQCDRCKRNPLQTRPELTALMIDWALHDPSIRVRRQAAAELAQCVADGRVKPLMRTLSTQASDPMLQRIGRAFLRRAGAAETLSDVVHRPRGRLIGRHRQPAGR
jgi:hypothetical protein